jgi:hypothetical protein
MEWRWKMRGVASPIDSIGITAQALAGAIFGGDGGSMWTVQTGLSLYCTPSTALFFGYRLQELNAEDGTYTFDAGLQGLYMGGELRF